MWIAIFISLVFVFLFVDDLFSKKQTSAVKSASNSLSTGAQLPTMPQLNYGHKGYGNPYNGSYGYGGDHRPRMPFYTPDRRYIWAGDHWERNNGGFGGGFVLGIIVCVVLAMALFFLR